MGQVTEKTLSVFRDKGVVIDKKLISLNDHFKKLPRFVSDYLIAKLVKKDNPEEGLKRIDLIIREHFVDSTEKELIKSHIKTKGSHSLLGQIRCRYDQNKDQYWADIPAIGDANIRIQPDVISQYGETLLTTGAWGTVKIAFDQFFNIKSKKYPFIVTEFVPLQIIKIDVDDWIDKRNSFSTEEWIDLIVCSIGFDPDILTMEEKMLYLIRLVPFVENNVNLIELGPPETGKTFAYRSLSSYGFVISGAKTTVASLFYNKLRRKQGILCHSDCVMFDEIAHANWRSEGEMINLLKDFMNTGKFGRDTMEFSSDASIVFAGNIDCDREKREVKGFYSHLFACLPNIIGSDRAFLDRIHGYIPGWKVQQIAEAKFAKDVGFMADYFSEIMHQLRSRYYGDIISSNVDFGKMGQRNQVSITKIASGLLKLIHPHKESSTIEEKELKFILDHSMELRQTVLDQLAIIAPGEFKGVKLQYSFKEN